MPTATTRWRDARRARRDLTGEWPPAATSESEGSPARKVREKWPSAQRAQPCCLTSVADFDRGRWLVGVLGRIEDADGLVRRNLADQRVETLIERNQPPRH